MDISIDPKKLITSFVLFFLPFLITSCSVEVAENSCVLIKKNSEEKRDLGTTLFGIADSGRSDEDTTVEEIQAQGYKYIVEGTKMVIDNPQCFTSDELRIAKNLLGE
jgi:hypothetical protein